MANNLTVIVMCISLYKQNSVQQHSWSVQGCGCGTKLSSC